MRIALGCDHGGIELKEDLKSFLGGMPLQVEDFGTYSKESVDYPDYAEKVAKAVIGGRADKGILICGTGVGICISANKIHGIRAALAWTADIARLSRQHNDANVLCLSGRFTDHSVAREIVQTWLETPFEGGRHQRRIDKISQLEHS